MAHGLGRAAGVELRILATAEAAAAYTAALIEESLAQAVAIRGRAAAVLAGGTTPQPVHCQLVRFAGIESVDWLLGDERLVPPGSEESNRLTVERDLLDRLDVEASRRHLPDLELEPKRVIEEYAARVESVLDSDPEGLFDLVLLGVGHDVHTASLFPGGAVHDAKDRVVLGEAPQSPRSRLSLSAATLSRARQVVFLAFGESKAEAVRTTVVGGYDVERPASWIRPPSGRVLWVLDRAAARLLGDVE